MTTPTTGAVGVVGAGGFIGSRLVTALQATGTECHAFTRSRPAVKDGRADPALARCGTVFALASRITPAVAQARPDLVARDEADLADLLAALSDRDQPPVVVYPSSGGTVYDPAADPPYHEGTRVAPTSAYGQAKLDREAALCAAAPSVRPVVLRLGNVYGEGQDARAGYGVIAHWLEAAAGGLPLRLYGDPQSCRDYVHVDDVVDGLVAVWRRRDRLQPGAPLVLNLASGVPTSLESVLHDVAAAVGRPLRIEQEDARGFDRRDVWLDVTTAERLLGWAPAVALTAGITSAWGVRAHRPGAVRPDATPSPRRIS